MLKYKVLIGCQNDKTGKRFEPGDTVTDRDFPKKVIHNWISKGVLDAPAQPKSPSGSEED